jgi:hypothetical protein
LAEDRFLKPIANQTFLADLIAQKNTIPSNYNIDLGPLIEAFPSNANYEILWKQYLLPFLSRAVYVVALPEIVLQSGSNGLFLNNTEFSSNSGIDGLKFMQDTQLQHLEKRRPFIIEFLCNNKTTYTLFDDKICPCCEITDCKEAASASDLGIILY